MNIFDRIKADHDAARQVIKQLKATGDSAVEERTDLFNHLKVEMWVHHKVEEAVFYSYLRAGTQMHGESLEALNEHHAANGLFEELDTFPVDADGWLMKFKALSELVDHHMKEEEEKFFPKARKIIPQAIADRMGEQFDQRKKVVLEALQPLDVEAEVDA